MNDLQNGLVITHNVTTSSDAVKIDDKVLKGKKYYCKILYLYHNRMFFLINPVDISLGGSFVGIMGYLTVLNQ